MKKDKIIRIENFLDSLENAPMQEEQQAIVLQSEICLIGGDNSGSCDNADEVSCSGKNKGCTNRNGVCGGGDNRGGCTNIGKPGVPGAQ